MYETLVLCSGKKGVVSASRVIRGRVTAYRVPFVKATVSSIDSSPRVPEKEVKRRLRRSESETEPAPEGGSVSPSSTGQEGPGGGLAEGDKSLVGTPGDQPSTHLPTTTVKTPLNPG